MLQLLRKRVGVAGGDGDDDSDKSDAEDLGKRRENDG